MKIENIFKWNIIALVAFGWIHFIGDFLLKKLPLPIYFKTKKWIGYATGILTIGILTELIIIIIKAF